jgi:hypothetical protein
MDRPDNLPPVEFIASRYCRLVHEAGWLFRPERMDCLVSGLPFRFEPEPSILDGSPDEHLAPKYAPFEGRVFPGDVCDDNLCMDQAMRDFGVDISALDQHPDHDRDGYPDWFNDLWNDAYRTALVNGFKPHAHGIFFFCWGKGYDDRESKIETLGYMTPDLGFGPEDWEFVRNLSVGDLVELGESEILVVTRIS